MNETIAPKQPLDSQLQRLKNDPRFRTERERQMSTVTSKQIVDSQIRRLKAVKVTAEFLLCVFQTSQPRVIQCKGVPPDAKAVRIGYDAETNTVIAVYEHPSFPECKVGAIPQFIEPRFTAYYGDAAIKALSPTDTDESEQPA